MGKKLIVFAVVVLVGALLLAVLSQILFGRGVRKAVAPETASDTAATERNSVPPEIGKEITYTDSGFSPSKINIKAGDIVVFKNKSPRSFWPASAIHPAHAVYDGTTLSEHCKNGAKTPFDACKEVAPGSEWSFKFDKTGAWNYHDHLSASYYGTVVVE